MQDLSFDRTQFPYDAMGDYSVFLTKPKEEEEPPCEDPDRDETKLIQG